MKICVIGCGYVGLVSGACLSEFGWSVTAVDNDPERVAALTRGEVPIYEPGLEDIIARNAAAGRLDFTTDLARAVPQSDVVLLAVGTPMHRGDGHADLSYVYEAAEEVARHLEGFTVIVTKSTVPVGTSRQIEARVRAIRADADFAVCSNPEFLREGSAIRDFTHPDRVLIGCEDARAVDVMAQLYAPLALRNAPVMFVGRESAELAKYAANAFLAMKISFINEISDLCEATGADVQEVASAIGADNRIGGKFLHPGPGYGGSCFPKDVSALIRTAEDFAAPLTLVAQVEAVNTARKEAMADRIIAACAGNVKGKTIAVLGVTFKPNTDDMREAPSLVILPRLIEAGAEVRAFDPHGMDAAAPLLEGVAWTATAAEAFTGADATVVLTEWNEFRALDLAEMKARMAGDVLVDLRNIFSREPVEAAGFAYFDIGRGQQTER
ncbi:UDP-glucose 6-dehydrogenase [hydrothermal vent metagenome]|uniref:UDP-glucose 6-dehydrogenase n=1 Tax=hydrothermal vent metagenome TaxID=652676 RepID=A0A3B0TG01_9ZZZZ